MTDPQSSPPPLNPESSVNDESTSEIRWQPLSSRQRRVLGVLIEKARTTPDAYPMTLNGITTGCNQKSNRHPQMNLTADDVDDVLEELRGLGAVAEVQTGGRVPKFRHYAYDWFGVDKREIAVLCELMLRGEQTVGDLRARASRMQAIKDQAELREVILGLLNKNLMVEVTPPGRGQLVNHALHTEKERERMSDSPVPIAQTVPQPEESSSPPTKATAHEQASEPIPTSNPSHVEELRFQVESLTDTVEELTSRIERLEENLQSLTGG